MLAKDFVDDDDLKTFEEKYALEEKLGEVNSDTQFQYACCLVRSRYKEDIRRGIDLFNDLCTQGCDQRDILFFLGLAYYKLADYSTALKFTQRMLTIEPNNYQAKELKQLIESNMQKDGLLGMAVVGGAAALAGVLLGMIFAKKAK